MSSYNLTINIKLTFSISAYPILSQRGRTLLLYKRYTYAKYPIKLKNGWRWYCSRNKKCRGSINTDDGYGVISVKEHCHLPMTNNMLNHSILTSSLIVDKFWERESMSYIGTHLIENGLKISRVASLNLTASGDSLISTADWLHLDITRE